MNHFTALATGPVYEFPYTGYPLPSLPNFGNDIDALLASITSSPGAVVYNQPSTVTLQCVPQINTGPTLGSNTIVYQVPEDTPLETILQQLGISTNTLQSSNIVNNYYRSASHPVELFLPPSSERRRRLVCREVSDSEDDSYYRRPSYHRRRHRDFGRGQSPVAIHDLLSKVWNKAEKAPSNLQPSSSAPNLGSQWQAMRNAPPPRPPPPQSPPPNFSANNAWQAMQNAPPQITPYQQNAVANVWRNADDATEAKTSRLASIFTRMRQPTGNITQPPPQQNQEAVQDFFAARNVPYGVNLPPPPPQQNREAVQDFFAARNVPYGVNLPPPQSPQNREAVQNFFAARNVPYGANISPPPQQNREAVQDFFAARNVPYGVNMSPPPQQNREAVQNFFSARNLPYGVNPTYPSNPAVANVWNRADYSANQMGPPMISPSPPPINATWNRMQQGPRYPVTPSYGTPPMGGAPLGTPVRAPAPASFASLLSQAHRQNLPYAGAAY